MNTSKLYVLAIDIAKEVFQLHGTDEKGKKMLQKRLRRSELLNFVVQLPPCILAMESCGGSHYWAREFQKIGHTVRLIAPRFVQPFVKSSKNDANDAEGIAEAAVRPSMRFVSVKSIAHQDAQMVHRVRERLIRNRTALSNEIRGLLQEYGVVCTIGFSHLHHQLNAILHTETPDIRFSPLTLRLLGNLFEELKQIDQELEKWNQELNGLFEMHESAQRIEQIEGVGKITATAIIASVPNMRAFKSGRYFAAWLGLVPREHSSGGKTVLGGISKRGNRYLRTLLIAGARAALRVAPLKQDRKSQWITEKMKTRGFNKACVALAHKNARIIWALLTREEVYECRV